MVACARNALAITGASLMSRTRALAAEAARAMLSMAAFMSLLAAVHGWSRSTPMRGDDGFLPSTRRSRSLIAAAAKATSATDAANSPAVSRCHDTHFMPTLGNSRYDGLKPATPQKLAGLITEPPVCVPVAIGKKPAATPAAEPDDEPPGVCARFLGLRVLPGSRWANSVVTVLPRSVPPLRRISATSEASALGRWP